jgi:ABC-type multidrug transport system ATPase subunit
LVGRALAAGAGAVSLAVEQLTVSRGRRRVVDAVSFTLAPGELLAIVGANGAGKTTLLDAILGFLPCSAGRVTWRGAPLHTLAERARVFACLADDADPPDEVSVATLLAHARRFGGAAGGVADELERQLGLASLRRARAGELSRGEKRRLQLFGALCSARPVAVLDEPLGTFDPLQLLGVLDLLRDRAASGTALLMSVHQMSDAEKIASHILMLDAGRILAFGTLAELRAQADAPGAPLEAVFLALLRRARAAP